MAAEAGATVVAPEAVAGAAVAGHITQRPHRDHSRRADGAPTPVGTGRDTQTPAATTHNVDQSPAAPAAGRTGSPSPHSSATSRANQASNADRQSRDMRPQPNRCEPLTDPDTPVKGR